MQPMSADDMPEYIFTCCPCALYLWSVSLRA